MSTEIPSWQGEQMEIWTTKQLIEWISSLGAQDTTKQKLNKGIERKQINGLDFALCQDAAAVLALFDNQKDHFGINMKKAQALFNKIQETKKKYKEKFISLSQNENEQNIDTNNNENKNENEAPLTFPYQTKYIEEWNYEDLWEWLRSLDIINKDAINKMGKLIETRTLNGLWFLGIESGQDLVKELNDEQIGDKICDQIYNCFEHYKKDREKKANIQNKENMENITSSKKHKFKKNQKVLCIDSRCSTHATWYNKWFDCTIMKVEDNKVLVRYNKWSEKQDQWIYQSQWDIYIKTPPPTAPSQKKKPAKPAKPVKTAKTAKPAKPVKPSITQQNTNNLNVLDSIRSGQIVEAKPAKPAKSKFYEGQQILCIDTTDQGEHKKFHKATIKIALNHKVLVKYDGYKDKWNQWITENEWSWRIEEVCNMKKQYDDDNTNPDTWKSKKIDQWTCNELQDWIKSLNIQNKKYEAGILRAVRENEANGSDFATMQSGKDIEDSFNDYKVNDKFCRFIYHKLKDVINAGNTNTDNDDDNNTMNGVWTYKNVDDWTMDELITWMLSLNLVFENEQKVLKGIREAEMTGADINFCESADDITQSFDKLDAKIGKKIFKALQKARKTGKSSEKNTKPDDDYVDMGVSSNINDGSYLVQNKRSGIIGLQNLGNTCFINCVIQSLLQTPPLVQYLRTNQLSSPLNSHKQNKQQSSSWWGSGYGWSGGSTSNSNYNSHSSTMLDAFIGVAQEATKRNSMNYSTSPDSIVHHLRNSDIRFARGAQGDALAAISKMIQLLDENIIERQKMYLNKKDIGNHRGQWRCDNVMDEESEEDAIEDQLRLYNQYNSVIRSSMHFVEREILSCMNGGCDYKESRYKIKEKVLLPLEDHSININIDIYVPSLSRKCIAEEFDVMDYCSIETLQYQIFDRILKRLQKRDKLNEFPLRSMDQIKIKCVRAKNNKPLSEWIIDCNPQNECTIFSSGDISLFTIVEPYKKNSYLSHDKHIMVTIFNVFINEYGKVDWDSSLMSFDSAQNGKSISCKKPNVKGYSKTVFFRERIMHKDEECLIDINNKTIICFYVHENNRTSSWSKYDMKNIDEIWKCEAYIACQGNILNYSAIVSTLEEKLRQYKQYASSGSISSSFTKQYVQPLQIAVNQYSALAQNRSKAYKWVYQAFGNKTKNVQSQSGIHQTNINDALDVYFSTKILDRGASLKCKKCNNTKCVVFQQEKEIVKYPEILIFTIDRSINRGGSNVSKFSGTINYPSKLKKGPGYELYAVCNHSGSLRGGHYWAFVKGVDDNKWFNANDSSIREMYKSNVINASTAIILMYKKSDQ